MPDERSMSQRRVDAAKQAIKKHAPKTEINVMGEDAGGRWAQTRDAPGVKKYIGDNIPGGTIEEFGDRSITILPPVGGGDPYRLRMGEHMERPPKKPQQEWGSAQQIQDFVYPKGVDNTASYPIANSYVERLRNFTRSAGVFNGLSKEEAANIDNQRQREEIDAQIVDADFPDPRTGEAVRQAVEDMLDEQFVGLKLLSTSAEHKEGIPDNIYFEAGDGSRWEWNSNGEIHRAD